MNDNFQSEIETFLADDLLIELGNIRMSLYWMENDTVAEARKDPKEGLARVDAQLAELEAKAQAIYKVFVASKPEDTVREDSSADQPLPDSILNAVDPQAADEGAAPHSETERTGTDRISQTDVDAADADDPAQEPYVLGESDAVDDDLHAEPEAGTPETEDDDLSSFSRGLTFLPGRAAAGSPNDEETAGSKADGTNSDTDEVDEIKESVSQTLADAADHSEPVAHAEEVTEHTAFPTSDDPETSSFETQNKAAHAEDNEPEDVAAEPLDSDEAQIDDLSGAAGETETSQEPTEAGTTEPLIEAAETNEDGQFDEISSAETGDAPELADGHDDQTQPDEIHAASADMLPETTDERAESAKAAEEHARITDEADEVSNNEPAKPQENASIESGSLAASILDLLRNATTEHPSPTGGETTKQTSSLAAEIDALAEALHKVREGQSDHPPAP